MGTINNEEEYDVSDERSSLVKVTDLSRSERNMSSRKSTLVEELPADNMVNAMTQSHKESDTSLEFVAKVNSQNLQSDTYSTL